MRVAITRAGLLGGAFLLGLLAHGPASADDVMVGSDQKRTFDCAGGAAVINGGDNVLTLRNCATVTINGGDNKVDAGTAKAITVMGSDNTVTWTEVAGRKPTVVNMGTNNAVRSSAGKKPDAASGDVVIGSEGGVKGIVVLESGRHDSIDCAGGSASVMGSNNTLTFRNCREVSITGTDNQVDVGDAAAVAVLGDENEVTWTEGPGGSRPKVSNLGQGNVVKRRN